MKRREIRESAFKLTFESLFRDDSTDEIIALAEDVEEITVTDDVIKLFKGTIEKSDELNKIIEKYSEKRALDRIPKVNIAVLKLALYEVLYDEKVPLNVAINEAVLISKKYSQEADVNFVNGVLGAYSRAEGEKE